MNALIKMNHIYPIFLPQWGCPGRCVFCNQTKITAVEDYHPELILPQIKAFINFHKDQEKQIAFYGGSFTALPLPIRENLIDTILPLLDEKSSFRISTRPDAIDENILDWCKSKRIKTIELGIQDFSDAVLKRCRRMYDSKTALSSAKSIKEHGFELGIQLMPGLPGWTEDTLQFNHQCLVEVRASFLRLYPTIVVPDTELEIQYRAGSFVPLSLEEAIDQCADYLILAKKIDTKVIKLGLPSTIKMEDVIAGPYRPAFGEFVHSELIIRAIQKSYQGENTIVVDRPSYSLLMGHKATYYRLLCQRLDKKDLVLKTV